MGVLSTPTHRPSARVEIKYETNNQRKPKQSNFRAPSLYYTNCRSLNARNLDNLRQYATRYQRDILYLTETWSATAREDNSIILGYTCFSSNRRQRSGGGAAIYLRSCISSKIIAQYTSSSVSAIWLCIQHSEIATSSIIGCVYHPPSSNDDDTVKYMEDLLRRFSNLPRCHSRSDYRRY